ncbi:hypothetical protein SADUNF_Sadunf18G0114100 [Salix dunnii]|uniref:Reverse transcriptase Ty1/copia-type domain-containing protein n=1 Tax=Salix dunnii TaxID=1413687 RepID=A0A835J3U8_9ROSI|nr:hypothetical protein SADUNF_Sadunf18G0114100 [Salix dunnii]
MTCGRRTEWFPRSWGKNQLYIRHQKGLHAARDRHFWILNHDGPKSLVICKRVGFHRQPASHVVMISSSRDNILSMTKWLVREIMTSERIFMQIQPAYRLGIWRLFVLYSKWLCRFKGNSNTAIHQVIQNLHYDFAIKELGDHSYFLGVEVLQTNDGLYLTQRDHDDRRSISAYCVFIGNNLISWRCKQHKVCLVPHSKFRGQVTYNLLEHSKFVRMYAATFIPKLF